MNMNEKLTEAMVRESIEQKLIRYFGVKPDEANEEQIYKATVMSVKDILTEKRSVFREKVKKQHPKKVYYLCMEFLMDVSSAITS